MPRKTAALKTFAPAMGRQLLVAVGRKLDRLLQGRMAHCGLAALSRALPPELAE